MNLELRKKETLWKLRELYADAGDDLPELLRELSSLRRLTRLLVEQAVNNDELERLESCLVEFVDSQKQKSAQQLLLNTDDGAML